ncbi:hypothetical protein [Actinoplanes sp. NPDC048796]|uniref:hypothetical protein n=1 Tax=unclassified Actinoplanes TaxID=2626549 RepID=UPI00340318C4
MPFRPPPGDAPPDPRLDPFRERAGVLFDEGEQVGLLFLRVESFWWQVGGHLWWRRWSGPGETVYGYLEFSHGGFDDFVEDLDAVADELDDWRDGRFEYGGETYTVRWLDEEESRHVRVTTFKLGEW